MRDIDGIEAEGYRIGIRDDEGEIEEHFIILI